MDDNKFYLVFRGDQPINGARERALQIVQGVLAGDIQALEGVIALRPLVRSDPTIASKEDANLIRSRVKLTTSPREEFAENGIRTSFPRRTRK